MYIMTSPRSASCSGAGRTSVRRRCGTEAIVRTFAVTPSPERPFPRVTARASTPFSYTSSMDAPSSFGWSR
jgi:hypothetical protein